MAMHSPKTTQTLLPFPIPLVPNCVLDLRAPKMVLIEQLILIDNIKPIKSFTGSPQHKADKLGYKLDN